MKTKMESRQNFLCWKLSWMIFVFFLASVGLVFLPTNATSFTTAFHLAQNVSIDGPFGRPLKPVGNSLRSRPRLASPSQPASDFYDAEKAKRNLESPYGIDSPFVKKGNLFRWNGEEGARLIRELGIAWIMPAPTFGISPHLLTEGPQSRPGQFNFERHDRYVKYAQSLNLQILFVVNPRETISGFPPSPPRYPKDIDKYLEVVAKAVERYDGDGIEDMPGLRYPIKYWMILNEPFFKRYWGGTAEEYCRLYIETWHFIKKSDPAAKVVLSSLINPHMKNTYGFAEEFFKYYEKALKTGKAPDNIDAMDLHWISREEADQAYSDYKNGLKWLHEKSRKMGLKISETICTEACVLTENRKVVYRDLVKRYLLARSLGITKIFWSSLVSEHPQRDLFTKIALQISPQDKALDAYRFMVSEVGPRKCTLVMDDKQSFKIMVDKGPTVFWESGSYELKIKKSAKRCYDIFGNELKERFINISKDPVYCSDH